MTNAIATAQTMSTTVEVARTRSGGTTTYTTNEPAGTANTSSRPSQYRPGPSMGNRKAAIPSATVDTVRITTIRRTRTGSQRGSGSIRGAALTRFSSAGGCRE